MRSFRENFRLLLPKSFKDFPNYGEGPERYNLLRKNLVIIISAVALIPLGVMSAINYYQYMKTLKNEIVRPITRLINTSKHTLELFLSERQSVLSLIIREHSFEELSRQEALSRIFHALRSEFEEFVDLGLIDSSGVQRSYVGPYELAGKVYRDQAWFHAVRVRGVYISDVFLGYREFPHFVIAIIKETPTGNFYVLRATIDSEKFNQLISGIALRPGSDLFIINREGILQTPSRYHGNVLEKVAMPIPPFSLDAVIGKTRDEHGEHLLGYAYLRGTSFILVVLKEPSEVMAGWFTLKSEFILLLAFSVVVIVLVTLRTSRMVVDRIREADQARESYYVQMEQSAKLASLGRMAAGVAHEINNPLAIINEKAGLMKDLVLFSKKYQDRETLLAQVDSILKSVDRCRDITRRLLGFARHMDVKVEKIYLNELIEEVLGFLEKEAFHRNINLRLDFEPNLDPILHDRGQLQQVFLNIINNAFEAVENGGNISISTREGKDGDTVEVEIKDDGCGIPPEDLKHIFDPFYTRGKSQGTGLGLSITHGIVTKCGGDIRVQSVEGEGTTFTVKLPRQCILSRS
ncbi:MAG: two-component sensor histidine kinase [Deltaproteobacteria bacterium]|nr:two-component sensor histidine kinase [Deltaproteobacteria bacterium]MBW2071551.1 two-component sensor histidine kinase [Deltaproteobacteria bacterium]